MTRTITATVTGPARTMRRRATAALLGALLAITCLAWAYAASAQAAPLWSIAMSHKNPWGQVGKVDPYTGSAESFARGSGSNFYSIKVTNSSPVNAGATLKCNLGTWASSPTAFTYQWLRNGAPIGGATSSSYTLVGADEGTAVQCVASGVNAGGGSAAMSNALAISPVQLSVLPEVSAAPTIEGTPATGTELTCKNGTWAGSPTFAYQWYRNGAPIPGAVNVKYTVLAGDVSPASALQCEVVATSASGSVASLTATKNAGTPSPAVPTGTANATSPDTAGGIAVGTQLACTGGPAAAAVSYQWLRGGAAIAGATSASYTTAAADAGTEIQCQVTAANSEGATNALSTAALIAPVPSSAPPSSATPTVTGTAGVGQTLTCASGSWSGGPTFTYQWLHNGTTIAGATANTYVLQAADLGAAVQCQVLGTNAGGAVLADSAKAVVLPVPPSGSANPTISPATTPAANGAVLTCNNPSSWTGSPVFTYQWLRNGTPIVGATAQTYSVAEASDKEMALQCQVTATNSDGATTAVSSSVVGVSGPTPAIPTLTTVGTVTGTRTVGSTLTCNHGTWGGAPTTYTYQWLRNGSPIAGANSGSTPSTQASFTYALTASDLNKPVQCQVIAANAGGGASAISASAGTVTTPAPPTATASVPSPGSVTIADQLPLGMKLTSASITGTGWTCSRDDSNTTISCRRSDSLAAGASYPSLGFQVHVFGTTAPGVLTNTASVIGGGAASSAVVSDPTQVADIRFGVASLVTSAVGPDGTTPYTQAGGHPFAISGTVIANVVADDGGLLRPVGGSLRNLRVDLPAGLVGNPQNAPLCPLGDFASSAGALCPAASKIGFLALSFGGTPAAGVTFEGANTYPIFNIEAPPGHPAALGFAVTGEPFVLYGSVRSENDYAVSVVDFAVPAAPALVGSRLTICENGVTGTGASSACAAPNPSAIPFITNPTDCSTIPLTTAYFDSWENPGVFASMQSYTGAPSAPPAIVGGPTTTTTPVASSALTGCEELTHNWVSNPEYMPSISLRPESTQADSPTGYDVDLHVPQPETAGTLSTPALKKSTVTLPAGVSISPSAADGLQACSEAQIGLLGDNPIRFDEKAPACPDASKVGTMEIETPLLSKPLQGSVYLAKQDENPFHTRFGMYLALDDTFQGIVVKLAGKVIPDPQTGQITAVFVDNPQLPFSDLKLHFFGGPRAALANPSVCGQATTTTQLTPYSAVDPENPLTTETATPSDSFAIDSGPAGSACANTPQARPLTPGFSAGTLNPKAGATSPFTLKLTRADGQQEISSLSLTTPPGFAAILKGVPYCSEGAIKGAEAASGRAEQASSSCPEASQIGSVTTGAGPGERPFYVGGKAYLAGPYKGAPLSLVVITPAVAGPFDLGNVVVRVAFNVNPTNAQLTAKTDSIPKILDGIPLRIRSIAVNIDRSNFAINPTNCNQMAVGAVVSGASGATANVSSPFQVGSCSGLAFTPKLNLSLKGGTKRNDHPALTATLTQPEGQANIGLVQVALPHSEFLEQAHIRTVCTRVQFAAHQCPQGSIYGHAEAISPLLDQPLTGNVYLRSSDNKLPDLVVALRGPDSQPIEVELDGRIDSVHGGIRTSFEMVPDAPVSKFVLSMRGGKKGLLVNSRNICAKPQRATVRVIGQNGKRADQFPKLTNSCRQKRR